MKFFVQCFDDVNFEKLKKKTWAVFDEDNSFRFHLPFASKKTDRLLKKARKPTVRAAIKLKNDEILLEFIKDDACLVIKNDKESVEEYKADYKPQWVFYSDDQKMVELGWVGSTLKKNSLREHGNV